MTSVGNAATVVTNADLTGDVTSVGNATTLTNAPVIAKILTGYVSGAGTVAATDSILQAIQKLNGNNSTNANLTGPITSVGNATSVAAQTGTGSTFVMQASPTLTTPDIGTPSAGIVTNLTGTASININGTVGATTPAAATVTTLTASADSSFTSTGAVKIPASTTGNRPAGTTGHIRYNTTLNTFEGYGASSWGSIGGGGATGAGGDTVFQENQLIVTTSYTLSTGKSAMSVGPITINASAVVTVPSGYRWVVI